MRKNVPIYPVFLPHAGCPHRCVYCNQYAVTGMARMGQSPGDLPLRVRRLLETYFPEPDRTEGTGEIAFYGGTFTALGAGVIRGILDAALPWVLQGFASGIRFSTRPDGLSREVCSLLSDYPVKTVELGVQSLSDEVLGHTRRGYTAAAVEEAAAAVSECRWDLGIQLMAGLPGDSASIFLESVEKAIRLQPSFTRIYPTLVLEGTLLAEWYRRGLYRPLSLDEAVRWCVPALDAFHRAQVPVARMGLHGDAAFEEPGIVLGGPYHPSFGYLVKAARWRRRVNEELARTAGGGLEGRTLTISVARPYVSEVVGCSGENMRYWKERTGFGSVRVRGYPDWTGERLECSIDDEGPPGKRRRRRRSPPEDLRPETKAVARSSPALSG